ncbi:ricin-type beta-trefoil lectin domain protein [Catellatospora vulcania]|uniref:ricin-type beta-trefoil lectin domain protein n=1 Tax=Catellatospora vulcania TaxID=1460450 RepID=UPI0012D3A82C|nr:ricin-type beta-trefoil lectin domain protein [Catellatospora vulcania]
MLITKILRRLLSLVLVATAGVVGLTASPALAANCDLSPASACLKNSATAHVAVVNYWCWDRFDWYKQLEVMPCAPGTSTEVAPFGNVNDDVDAFRADANCITKGQGTRNALPFSVNRDRRNQGSEWYKIFDVDSFLITEKNCFPPTGLHATSSNQSSITIAWNPIPGADYKVYVNGVYPGGNAFVYGNNGTVSSYTRYNLTAGTTYTFAVTMVRGSIETTKSGSISVTTGALPPAPWQYNTQRQLKNAQSGLCLVVQGTADGSQAFMHDCSVPYADQLWVTRAGNGGGTEIANANSGMCLVSPYWFDFGVTQTYCDIYPDSKWVVLDTGPTYRLQNLNSGQCLVGSTVFAYNATMAPCSSSQDQKWSQR